VAHAWRTGEPLSVLLVDGDNLRQYNQISYEAGDEAILLLGVTLQLQLRQSDFLARWRTGDEFLILLPNTGLERALHIGQRLCAAVERASRAWLLPSTVSVGAAAFPEHGQSVQELLHVAERGLEMAKDQGKNRAAVCQPD
jgi:diguanylate cyclase (GGDEF)-like protein